MDAVPRIDNKNDVTALDIELMHARDDIIAVKAIAIDLDGCLHAHIGRALHIVHNLLGEFHIADHAKGYASRGIPCAAIICIRDDQNIHSSAVG